MDIYKCYRLTLNLKSPCGTPWQADTIIGHLAWLMAYQEGNEGVTNFLKPFLEGEPPFILSDAFPACLLPRPMWKKAKLQAEELESYVTERLRLKAEFLSIDDFQAVRLGKSIEIEPIPSPWIGTEMLHASINRETGTTGEGGNLFMTESWTLRREFWEGNHARLAIYVYCLDGWIERIEKMFHDLALVGFGKDKSVGLGYFEVAKTETWDGFSVFPESNGFISLSTFVPNIDDPSEGQWAVNIKYGKLGENAGSGNPFKRPLLQIRPGSVFYTGSPPKPFYGRVVKGVARSFPEAIQICYCLAVPCRLKN